jgi:SNF2 family DNA or RNA helicase
MKAVIKVTDGRIRVAAPFAFGEALKAMPGARWQWNDPNDKKKGGWRTFPASPLAAQAVATLFQGAPGVRVEADDAFQRLLATAEGIQGAQGAKHAQSLPDVPVTRTSAWLHQKQAFWAAHAMPAMLLDMGMGTGKTKVVCDLIVNRDHRRVLVLCPKKVVPTWPDEMRTHGGRLVKVIPLKDDGMTASGRPRTITTAEKVNRARLALALCEAAGVPCVIVINYESAWRAPFGPSYEAKGAKGDVRMIDEGFALTAGFDLVVMDESHKIKAPGGRASRFCAKFPEVIPHRLALTGTPMAHGPLDVYAQFRALDPGLFGTSFQKFRDRYAIMGGFEKRQVLGYQNQEEFAQKMALLTYHVGSEVLDLPPARHQRVYCTLEPETRRLYRQLEKDMLASFRKPGKAEETEGERITITADNILVKMLRCQQIACGFVKDEDEVLHKVGTAKRDLLADTMQDFPTDQPLVVFCKFTHDLDAVHAVCAEQGRTSGEISGRRDDLQGFKDGAFSVVAVQIQAGGAGVDLTRADVAIYFSVGYSLADYQQSLKRLDRPTFDKRKRSVLNIHLLAEGTIDEEVYTSLANKEDVVEGVMKRIKARQAAQDEEALAA